MRFALLVAFALVGCNETGITATPPLQENPLEDDDASGGVNPDRLPDDVLTGGLTGVLCNEPETPLEGATVYLEHAYGVARGSTDREGRFLLEDLPIGEYVLVVEHPDYRTQISVSVSPNEIAEVPHDECIDDCGIPVPCMGLAEAYDRNHVTITAEEGGTVEIINVGTKHNICLEDWVVVLSEGSQDAVLGQDPRIVLRPGQSHVFDYAQDVYSTGDDPATEAWWCVEQFQVIAAGQAYRYNGSLAPDIVYNWIEDRTDANVNGIEDHIDRNFENRIQSQVNIWETERDQPILLVGRKRHVHRFETAESATTVTLEALNLGQAPLEGSVIETVPRGFIVTGTQPAAIIRSEANGDTSIRWDLMMDAAQPVDGIQAIYDVRWLSYTLRVDENDLREGRIEGEGVYGSWTDTWRRSQQSFSEPLILEVCPRGLDEEESE